MTAATYEDLERQYDSAISRLRDDQETERQLVEAVAKAMHDEERPTVSLHWADLPNEDTSFGMGKTLLRKLARAAVAEIRDVVSEKLRALHEAADELNGEIDRQTYDENRRLDWDPLPEQTYVIELTAKQIRAFDAAIVKSAA